MFSKGLTLLYPWTSSFFQAERELKDDLEVKLVVSSLVCTVADKASTQNSLERAAEDTRLEKVKLAGVVEGETNLRAELEKTNKVVKSLQTDFDATREWQTGADSLRLKLMGQIEELKVIAEVRLVAEVLDKTPKGKVSPLPETEHDAYVEDSRHESAETCEQAL